MLRLVLVCWQTCPNQMGHLKRKGGCMSCRNWKIKVFFSFWLFNWEAEIVFPLKHYGGWQNKEINNVEFFIEKYVLTSLVVIRAYLLISLIWNIVGYGVWMRSNVLNWASDKFPQCKLIMLLLATSSIMSLSHHA